MKTSEFTKTEKAVLDPDSPLSRVLDMIEERRYTVKAADLSSRVLSHWVDQKILPKIPLEEGCYKFSIHDLFYIEIIKTLREFGLSMPQLRKVRECLVDMPQISPALIQIFANDSDQTYLVVNRDGVAWVVGSDFLLYEREEDEDEDPIDFTSFICLHLNKIILPLLNDQSRVQINYPIWGNLSKPERETISAIRKKNIEELRIKFKNGKPVEIEEIWTEGNAKKAIEDGKFLQYGQFTVQIQNGRMTHGRIARKKRF